jgi:hypothetical protein
MAETERKWKDVEIIEKYFSHDPSAFIEFFFTGIVGPSIQRVYEVTATDVETGRRVTGKGKTLEEAWKDLEQKL